MITICIKDRLKKKKVNHYNNYKDQVNFIFLNDLALRKHYSIYPIHFSIHRI